MQQEPHAGAPGVHGSEPGDSTAHDAATQRQLDPIQMMRPWAGPEELHLRKRLHNAVVLSAARGRDARSAWACSCFWTINEIANHYLLANVPRDELQMIADALVRMFLAADAFDRAEAGK